MPQRRRSGFGFAILATGALSLAGCGGGGSDDTTAPPPTQTPPPTTPPPSTPPPGNPPPSTPPASGLDARPSNASCVAPDRATGSLTLAVQRAFPSLSFASPVAMVQAPGDASRWFVVEQNGVVRSFANDVTASTSSVFIDVDARVTGGAGSETGLLGIAFHPGWPANPRVYLSYTGSNGSQLVSRVSEFRSTDGGATLSAGTETVLFTINQPESNHNGGGIAFGSDGFLYIGIGDGGGGGDQHGAIGNGQSLQTLLGKMLRIDVSGTTGATPYRIPSGNPFPNGALCGAGNGTTTQPNCAEIYAWGFRNPWRWSFDRGSSDLWVADVGQGALEEVNRVTAGGNYGWRCREGTNAFNANCGPAQSLIDPVAQYGRAAGASITGGYVYRGNAIPALVGRYVFGDFVSGRIWHIARDTAPTLTVDASSALATNFNVSSFAEGNDGELYVLNYSGTIHRLTAASGSGGSGVPTQLSQTGCVSSSNASQPAGGLIPYAANAPFWSDGAQKERWVALPNGQNIVVGNDGDWDFPNGTVLVKNFRLGSQLVETRLFMRHPDGVWAGYSYQWNAQGTDATLVPSGTTAQVGNPAQTWVFPSGAQCLQCHTQAAGRALGLETAQMNRDFAYPQTGRTANQIVTLNSIGTLAPPITAAPSTLPSMPDPYGSAGTLAERARAYLHTNCSQCHRPSGGTPSNLDLRYETSLAATSACNADPQSGTLGIPNARIIAPGDAARSVLVARMNRRDASAMPPLASTVVDQAGVQLISSWINTVVTSCN